jgi:outer membrane protein OmpA-like peptidoglycan-associated protein
MADISIAYWFGNSRYTPAPVVTQPIIVEEVAQAPTEPTLEDLEARNISALENDQLPAIYVDFGSTELNEAALNELKALVTALNAFPDAQITIQGHTDSIGPRAFNQKLSERRAARVYQYLVDNGIDKARLSTVGFGLDNPVADNETEEGRSQNRRIDFVITQNADEEIKQEETNP